MNLKTGHQMDYMTAPDILFVRCIQHDCTIMDAKN